MKKILTFDNNTDYTTFIESLNYITPVVSYDQDKVYFTNKINRQDPGIEWSHQYSVVSLEENSNLPTLSNPNIISNIKYSSSNPNVATISNNGTITSISEGKTIITASYKGDINYLPKTIKYILIVSNSYRLQYFTSEAINDCTFTFKKKGSGDDIQYSLDNGVTWNTLASEASTPLVSAGSKVLWKSTILPSTVTTTNLNGIGTFNASDDYKVYGNIMSLLFGDDFVNQISLAGKDYAFCRLFYDGTVGNNHLQDVENLIMPAEILSFSCYREIFQGTGVTKAVKDLPATIMTEDCYRAMYCDCYSLTTYTQTHEISLATNCFRYMYGYCAITDAPELPCTILYNGCYLGMFRGCTLLTETPELPALTLNENCYSELFRDCKSITYIKCLATDISANNCLYNWTLSASPTGTFIKNPKSTKQTNSKWSIPAGWTIIDDIDEDEELKDAGFYWDYDLIDKHINSTKLKVFNNPNNIEGITFTSSDNKIVTINSTGNIILHNLGQTTLTAQFEGNETYNPLIVSCKINVVNYDYSKEYFTIMSLEDNNHIGITKKGNINDITLSISIDNGKTWTNKTMSNNYANLSILNKYEKILIKGTNKFGGNDINNYISFSINKKYIIEGNISSLLISDNFINQTVSSNNNDYMFKSLFQYECSLISAENLILPNITTSYCYCSMFSDCNNLLHCPDLPANSLSSHCYTNMFKNDYLLKDSIELPAMTMSPYCYESLFYNCTSITEATELPATTLAAYCYSNIFNGCASITVAPELPATTLATRCYNSMFKRCTSITVAPELPATTMESGCYEQMFYGCSSLITAPELSSTTLASNCYHYMFNGCTSLTEAPELPATTLMESCYYGMFNGCTSLTEAPELPATTLAEDCYHDMLYGCTSLTTAPSALPATIAPKKCYYNMFYGCTSLIEAPELPATTLAEDCYNQMFYNCTSLTTAPSVLPATIAPKYCYYNMFYNCTSLINIPEELPATTLAERCYNNMFRKCTSLISAPNILATTISGVYACSYMFSDCTSLTTAPEELPATTLATSCYDNMFAGCTSLTTAPELPATTLTTYCYGSMFYNCTSLTTAPSILPATTLATSCYYNMFNGCYALTEGPELPATTLAENCYEGMFSHARGLIKAPDLLAPILVKNCYKLMLEDCKSLTYVKCLATDISASGCLYNWLISSPNSSSCTFVKDTSTTFPVGVSGIPSNWIIQNAA